MIKKSFLFLAVFALFFASCQKEEGNLTKEPQEYKDEGVLIYANKAFPDKEKPTNSKFPRRKLDSVYIYTDAGVVAHKTRKFKKHDGTNYQEWLLVNLKTDVFSPLPKYWAPAEALGIKNPYYYTWDAGVVNPSSDDSFDFLAYTDETAEQNIPGFHIPTQDDLMTLGATLGNTNLIPLYENLNLQNDGVMRFHEDEDDGFFYTDDPTDNRKVKQMWVDLRGTHNGSYVPDCGSTAYFVANETFTTYELQYFFTNNQNMKACIRLVRDLPVNEW